MGTEMTVCIGNICQSNSAVVLVADRMVTSGLGIEFEQPITNKVTLLSDNCVALTAGNAFAFTELFNAVQVRTANSKFTSVEQFIEVIKVTYQAVRQQKMAELFLTPRAFQGFDDFHQRVRHIPEAIAFNIFGEMERYDYGLDILVGGVTGNKAHLYSITDPGTSNCLDSLGFQAIGSGMNLAMSSLIADKCHRNQPWELGMLNTVAAKVTAENAPGVGSQTDITLILPNSQVVQFDEDEVAAIKSISMRRKEPESDWKPDFYKALAKKVGMPDEYKTDTIEKPSRNGTESHDSKPDAKQANIEASSTPEPSGLRTEDESENRAS